MLNEVKSKYEFRSTKVEVVASFQLQVASFGLRVAGLWSPK